MTSRLRELPRSAWHQAMLWTAITIAASTVVSVAISVVLLGVISDGINGPGLVTSIVMPLILGTPIMFYMQVRHQQLKLAYRKLDILASTDSLTDCLNRRAFTAGAASLLATPGESHVRSAVEARIGLARARAAQHRAADATAALDQAAALLETHPQATHALRERLDAVRRELAAARRPRHGVA